ncbi:hypothetical protein ACVWWO_003567 [Bradyrhizobium sp. F1.13.1]
MSTVVNYTEGRAGREGPADCVHWGPNIPKIGSYSRSYFRGLIDCVWISFGVVLQVFAGLSGAEMSREERSLC